MIGRVRSLYRGFAFARSARIADVVMANAFVTRDDICHFIGLGEDKVKVVWEAVDECFIPSDAEAQAQIRARFGLRRPYVLFSSTLWRYKNAHSLIRAFSKLHNEGKIDADLVFAGRKHNQVYQGELEALIAEGRVAERVKFLGFVPNREMPPLYTAAAAFVYPSLLETFGKPVLEAMGCQVPVIASNLSCIPEITGDGALLVNPLDVDELANAIHCVLTDERLRLDLIERGKRRSKCFSWRVCAQETLALFATAYEGWQSRKGR
jgi:glycosyltransferase involved in cell wall biosynthesis